jgi:hypothetical protein
MKIGIDFDNTLVDYELAFPKVGKAEGLLPAEFTGGKLEAKDWLTRERPDGYLWEKLQGIVYGRRIEVAVPYDGALAFLEACTRAPDIELFIVSHKTLLAHHDDSGTNLRTAALTWLTKNDVFDSRYGIAKANVYFEATRDEKVARIAALGLDVFIDDLPEVLTHPGMPPGCRKFLLRGEEAGPYERVATWNDFSHAIFGHS